MEKSTIIKVRCSTCSHRGTILYDGGTYTVVVCCLRKEDENEVSRGEKRHGCPKWELSNELKELKYQEWLDRKNQIFLEYSYLGTLFKKNIKIMEKELNIAEILKDKPKEGKKCEFKPMDWCLMRMYYSRWNLCQYAYYREDADMFVAIGGKAWKECIPYNEETKHLLGTTDDWEGGEK